MKIYVCKCCLKEALDGPICSNCGETNALVLDLELSKNILGDTSFDMCKRCLYDCKSGDDDCPAFVRLKLGERVIACDAQSSSKKEAPALKKKVGKDECPHGHLFGVDCDDTDDCDDCKNWDACTKSSKNTPKKPASPAVDPDFTSKGIAMNREIRRLKVEKELLIESLENLMKVYFSNRGTDHEFVSCVTPDGVPAYWRKAEIIVNWATSHL